MSTIFISHAVTDKPVKKKWTFVQNVGAADKAAIQLVKVQPYQLLVSDT